MTDMKGKVALVTGAAGGIGSAICTKLHEHGVQVVATDIDEESLGVLAGRCNLLLKLHLDVTRPEDWQAALRAVNDDAGQLDILVNNAGVAQFGDLETTPYETWREILSVGAAGPRSRAARNRSRRARSRCIARGANTRCDATPFIPYSSILECCRN